MQQLQKMAGRIVSLGRRIDIQETIFESSYIRMKGALIEKSDGTRLTVDLYLLQQINAEIAESSLTCMTFTYIRNGNAMIVLQIDHDAEQEVYSLASLSDFYSKAQKKYTSAKVANLFALAVALAGVLNPLGFVFAPLSGAILCYQQVSLKVALKKQNRLIKRMQPATSLI